MGPTSKLDDPGPLPPKLVFLDHFFGENHCFRPFNPMNTPKCYTWLESYGSPPYDGKKKKLFVSPCEASDFRGRSRTDFLHGLRLRRNNVYTRKNNLENHMTTCGADIVRFRSDPM